MFTPKANSKQKRAKNANFFQICLTENRWPNCSIRGPIFVEPNWKNSPEFGGRVWQFGGRFWASQQFKNQFNNAFFT